jgi:hypothetical protein
MAQMRVPRDYDFEVSTSRGFLRAPWNINPSAKVTRHHSLCGVDEISPDYKHLVWPTCEVHLGMVTSSTYSTWCDSSAYYTNSSPSGSSIRRFSVLSLGFV